MQGVVQQICTSRGGIPKYPLLQGKVNFEGLAGDSWRHPKVHGGPLQALLLITAEGLEELIAAGYPLFPGALGENITTRGLNRKVMRLAERYRVGTSLLELTKVRVPCATLDIYGPRIKKAIFDNLVKNGDASTPVWGLSGFYARVIEPGEICQGDSIALESGTADAVSVRR
ncbi:MAG: MOSC domain-containing protein [Bryobacteraceae bacterium]